MGKFTEGLSLSRHRFLVLCIVAMTLSQFSAAGCGGQNNARSSGEAFIKASPNPVAARGESGKTTISWSTGEDGEGGQVYVSADGKQEKLFAEGKEGPQEAPWIAQGKEYEFRLYAGTEHKKLLDSVKVTRSEEDSPAAVSDQEAQSMSEEAFIKASPNPVAARGESGKTTISWSTGEDGEGGQVYVSERGKPEKLFAEGASGSQQVPWIAQDKEYRFRLYAGKEHKTPLESVKVKGT